MDTPKMAFHNYFNLHVSLSRPLCHVKLRIPAIASQNVTDKSCSVCAKSEQDWKDFQSLKAALDLNIQVTLFYIDGCYRNMEHDQHFWWVNRIIASTCWSMHCTYIDIFCNKLVWLKLRKWEKLNLHRLELNLKRLK